MKFRKSEVRMFIIKNLFDFNIDKVNICSLAFTEISGGEAPDASFLGMVIFGVHFS